MHLIRVLGLASLLLVAAGCHDRSKCQPELWGPVGSWNFVALDEGVVMTNRLFDGWQDVKGAAWPVSDELEYPGYDRPWLMVAGSPASYGLRFSTSTTAACDPSWAAVSVDGEPVATRVKRRTVFEHTCGASPHAPCPEDRLTEEVDDVIFDWTPARPGHSLVSFEWGGYQRTLQLLIAEAESEPPVATIPARCRRVQRIDDDTWLCDRVAYRNGVAEHSWPDTSLVATVGDATVVEWGSNRVRRWSFVGGLATVTADLDAGVSPAMRWDGGTYRYFDRDDIRVLDGGCVLFDAEQEVLILDDARAARPQLSNVEFGAQVVSVDGQPVSVRYLGNGMSHVCPGLETLDAGACLSVWGNPVAGGEQGVWFVNGGYRVTAVSSSGGELYAASLVGAEDMVHLQYGTEDYRAGRIDRDAGEPLFGYAHQVTGETRQGGCLFYDVQLDGGLIPRVYSEVGELAPPSISWGMPQGGAGDGDGDWRWCQKRGAGVTHVYRAPRR